MSIRFADAAAMPAVRKGDDECSAVYDGDSILFEAFNPLLIPWYQAYWAENPAQVFTDGQAVSQWDDASGNGRHLTQPTAGARPTYRASVAALNGRPGLEFDGGDWLARTMTTMVQPFTLVVVGVTAPGVGVQTYVGGTSSASTRFLWRNSGTPGTYQIRHSGTALVGPVADSNVHLLEDFANGASSAIKVDGFATVGNAGTAATGASFVVGARNPLAPAEFLTGHISFVGLIAGALT